MLKFIWTSFLICHFQCIQSLENVKPIVLWHGMGDSCCGYLSMGYITRLLRSNLGENLYVHSLMLGNNIAEDVEHGYFSDMNDVVEEACEKLKNDVKLQNGFNIIGFSQGGLFVRALAQRCTDLKINTLVAIGGPQQGIYGIPFCPSTNGLCDAMRHLLRYGAYANIVQKISVQAQYWHDPYLIDDYVRKSIFLADLNCEHVEEISAFFLKEEQNSKAFCNSTYKENLIRLQNMVLVKFEKDQMIKPNESSWFGYYPDNNSSFVVAMEKTPLFKEDHIGLKTLSDSNRLHLLSFKGQHLQIPESLFISEIINKYLRN